MCRNHIFRLGHRWLQSSVSFLYYIISYAVKYRILGRSYMLIQYLGRKKEAELSSWLFRPLSLFNITKTGNARKCLKISYLQMITPYIIIKSANTLFAWGWKFSDFLMERELWSHEIPQIRVTERRRKRWTQHHTLARKSLKWNLPECLCKGSHGKRRSCALAGRMFSVPGATGAIRQTGEDTTRATAQSIRPSKAVAGTLTVRTTW